MRVIIINDAEARALLDKLELTSLRADNIMRADPDKPATLADVHRAFRYVVCRWLQEIGVDITGDRVR